MFFISFFLILSQLFSLFFFFFFFFFKQKTAYEMLRSLVGSEMCIRDSSKTVNTKAPTAVISGIQEVTRAIEKKTAKLVLIANNVEPLELVLWMPTLCRKSNVPYAIVKDKARLGDCINQKTAAVIAFTEVKPEDETVLKNVVRSCNARFMARSDVIRRQWGGRQLSLRSRAALRKKRARTASNIAGAN
eukprot:TRINITY_DN744_c0_g1_i1.p1 TRINITY_DN744_c0_g1~~TRINITY_DN744_c0_g1_i1.p1  ORF type:complete len:189 (+),score=83.67 TRINITY_DN744_c0_g1_i1:77-643(+)